jgi:hypothetical protein
MIVVNLKTLLLLSHKSVVNKQYQTKMKFSAIALSLAAMSAGVHGFAVNNRAASFAVRNVSLIEQGPIAC